MNSRVTILDLQNAHVAMSVLVVKTHKKDRLAFSITEAFTDKNVEPSYRGREETRLLDVTSATQTKVTFLLLFIFIFNCYLIIFYQLKHNFHQ